MGRLDSWAGVYLSIGALSFLLTGCVEEYPSNPTEAKDGFVDSETVQNADFGKEWSVEVLPSQAEADMMMMPSTIFFPSGDEVKLLLVFEANADGSVEFADAAWRQSALENGYALAEVKLVANDGAAAASMFPEQAASRLMRILSAFAAVTGHTEIETCKLALWGHSAGSHLMTPVASILSDRIAAYVAYKGGAGIDGAGRLLHEDLLTDAKFLKIPGLVIVASNEPDGLKDAGYVLFAEGRARGARMMMAIEKNGFHIGVGTTNDIMIPFIEAVVSASGTAESGWMGRLSFHRVKGRYDGFSTDVVDAAQIAPFQSMYANATSQSLIPTEALAELWQAYETESSPRTL